MAEYLKELATVGCLGWSIIICLAMTRVYDPANGLCYTDDPLFIERLVQTINTAFMIICGVSIVNANYRRNLKNSTSEDDAVSTLWNGFFNQLLLAMSVATGISLIVAYFADDAFDEGKDDLVFINLLAFTIWSYIYGNFLDSLSNFLGTSNPDVTVFRNSNRWRQTLTFFFAAIMAILMGVLSKRVVDGSRDERILMFVLLIGKLIFSLFLVGYYIWIYKIIHKDSFTMITAILQGYSVRASNPLTRGTLANVDSAESMTYSSRYFQIHRLISLLKMLTTAIYLEIVTTVVLFLVVFSSARFGNLFLYFFMKLISAMFPFLYLVSCGHRLNNLLINLYYSDISIHALDRLPICS